MQSKKHVLSCVSLGGVYRKRSIKGFKGFFFDIFHWCQGLPIKLEEDPPRTSAATWPLRDLRGLDLHAPVDQWPGHMSQTDSKDLKVFAGVFWSMNCPTSCAKMVLKVDLPSKVAHPFNHAQSMKISRYLQAGSSHAMALWFIRYMASQKGHAQR